MIQVNNLSYSIDHDLIFSGLTFSVQKGDKIGLIGPNGVGKSTLLKILAGQISNFQGQVTWKKGLLWAYAGQELQVEGNFSLLQFLKNYTGLAEIERELQELEPLILAGGESERYYDLLQQYADLDGYEFADTAQRYLQFLGLDLDLEATYLATLSGGQKRKLLLGAVLLKPADLLILDEPTNDLDLEALLWLEDWIAKSSQTFLLVSHDRSFLDRIVNKILVFDAFSGELEEHHLTYSEYLEYRRLKLNGQLRQYEEQQNLISRLEKDISTKKAWSDKGAKQKSSDNDKFAQGYKQNRSAGLAKSAKAAEKKLEQLEPVEKIRVLPPLRLKVTASSKAGGRMEIQTEHLDCGYGSKVVLRDLSLVLDWGQKILIRGANGTGKSTLIKTLLGEIPPLGGRFIWGNGLKAACLAQDLGRDLGCTVEEYVTSQVDWEAGRIFTVLNYYGFEYDCKDLPLRQLSPGQRLRVNLALFSMQEINTLILDEPTNHLDIEALEALEEVLQSFEGLALVVSHDRQFIKKVKFDRVLEVKEQTLQEVSWP